jgi:hypothetical protein
VVESTRVTKSSAPPIGFPVTSIQASLAPRNRKGKKLFETKTLSREVACPGGNP